MQEYIECNMFISILWYTDVQVDIIIKPAICDASTQCNLDHADGDGQFVPLGSSTPQQDDLDLTYTTKDGDVSTEPDYLSQESTSSS